MASAGITATGSQVGLGDAVNPNNGSSTPPAGGAASVPPTKWDEVNQRATLKVEVPADHNNIGHISGPGFNFSKPQIISEADQKRRKLEEGRPAGDQRGMPPGVAPTHRLLTEADLPERPLDLFLKDPASFAASYFIDTMGNFVMPGRTVPPARPGETVDGSGNIVGFTMNRVDGQNVQMTVTGVPSELGRPGTPSSSLAYYLPFTNGGATTIRVPRHPTAADPQFLVTGPFTGCSFYVREDPNDPDSLLFTHDPRRGVGTTTSPTGIPEGAVGMSYESSYGQADNMPLLAVPSASAFAQYNRTTRQWVMNVQDATVQLPLPGTTQGGSTQRSRVPGHISGAFIPIQFGALLGVPAPPPQDPNEASTSTPLHQDTGSFWGTIGAGGATGAVIGGVAGAETGPGAVITSGAGALLGGAIAGMGWLFNWAQHDSSRP